MTLKILGEVLNKLDDNVVIDYEDFLTQLTHDPDWTRISIELDSKYFDIHIDERVYMGIETDLEEIFEYVVLKFSNME